MIKILVLMGLVSACFIAHEISSDVAHSPQTKPTFPPVLLTGKYNCRTKELRISFPEKGGQEIIFKDIQRSEEIVSLKADSSFPFELFEARILARCVNDFSDTKIISRSMTLITSDNAPIIVNGREVSTGAKLRKNSKIQTPAGVGATVAGVGSIGISPNSNVTLQMDSSGKVTLSLTNGCIRIFGRGAIEYGIYVGAMAYVVYDDICSSDGTSPAVDLKLSYSHAGAHAVGVNSKKSQSLQAALLLPSFYVVKFFGDREQFSFELFQKVIGTAPRKDIIKVRTKEGCKVISDSVLKCPDGSTTEILQD